MEGVKTAFPSDNRFFVESCESDLGERKTQLDKAKPHLDKAAEIEKKMFDTMIKKLDELVPSDDKYGPYRKFIQSDIISLKYDGELSVEFQAFDLLGTDSERISSYNNLFGMVDSINQLWRGFAKLSLHYKGSECKKAQVAFTVCG